MKERQRKWELIKGINDEKEGTAEKMVVNQRD